jgi:hypothetical protein
MPDAQEEITGAALAQGWKGCYEDNFLGMTQWLVRDKEIMTIRYRMMGNTRMNGFGVQNATVMNGLMELQHNFTGANKRGQIVKWLCKPCSPAIVES